MILIKGLRNKIRESDRLHALKSKISKLKGLKVCFKERIYDSIKKVVLKKQFKTTVITVKNKIHDATVVIKNHLGNIIVAIIIVAASFFATIELPNPDPIPFDFSSNNNALIERVIENVSLMI